MTGFNYSCFLAQYKDRPEDTWLNVSFVNNCKEEISSLKVESVELRVDKASGLSEVTGVLSKEYVNIPSGEYVLLEMVDSSDLTIDIYKYNFEIQIGHETIRVGCQFSGGDFMDNINVGMLPVINENGRMYLCA